MIEDFKISAEIRHQGSKGAYRENTLRKFLSEGRLPSRYGVGEGEIVGYVRNVSRQSDLIIYDQINGIALIYDDNTQVFPIECVVGTVEVKSTLSKTAFIEALENIKSVKKLAPRETIAKSVAGRVTVSYPRPRPFGAVFGYQLGRNSLSSLGDNLREWEKDTPKEWWPNVVAVLDEGIIHHYRNGTRVAYTNRDLGEATCLSSIHYKRDALFKFYSAIMDLCASSDLGPIVLSKYFDQAEQLGEHVVSNHDRFLRSDCDAVFKLTAGFVSKVVSYCREEGALTEEQVLMRRFGQIPVGLDKHDLQERVFLYNPGGLKGIQDVDNALALNAGKAVVADGVMEPCHYIVVDGEAYYIPGSYIAESELEKVPGRTANDL
ncbi:MAG: hypothetical protein OXC31_15475 [Spirochaetaceae bacterium]|nr:hypothetical protein [Spirochaetaceae bacterium]